LLGPDEGWALVARTGAARDMVLHTVCAVCGGPTHWLLRPASGTDRGH
jgi:hypothetical protein